MNSMDVKVNFKINLMSILVKGWVYYFTQKVKFKKKVFTKHRKLQYTIKLWKLNPCKFLTLYVWGGDV